MSLIFVFSLIYINSLTDNFCQAQPKPKPQLKLSLKAELALVLVNPATHPPVKVYFETDLNQIVCIQKKCDTFPPLISPSVLMLQFFVERGGPPVRFASRNIS